jgi:Ca-activated chloride channel family protein
MRLLVLFATTLAFAPSALGSRAAAPAEAPHFVVSPVGGAASDKELPDLPLESTHTDVRIAGVIAQVRVQQVWRNTGDVPLEARYVFPGSTRAAVFGMRMRVGDRLLEARIHEKKKARKIYDDAKSEGKAASLLEQHRPNVFQMHVANILPGDKITVELDYTELVVPTGDVYELVLPQVVGPRYTRAAPEVPTPKWLNNPYLAEGEPPPWGWSADVELSAGVPITAVGSPSHGLSPEFLERDHARLSLRGDADDPGGDRDLVLRYRLRGEEVKTGVLLFRDKEDESFFLLMMQPPERVAAEQMPPREVVFVVDVSGSMNGFPLDTAKKLVTSLGETLRPQDRFNLLFFAGGSFLMSPQSLPASKTNLRRAMAVLDDQRGGGGTNLDLAVNRALKLPRSDDARTRHVVVVSDGYVGFEKDVFQTVRENLDETSLYAFGVGSSVNRHLIEGLAEVGGGEPYVVLDPAEVDLQVSRFARTAARPAVSDIEIDFDGFDAYELEPPAVPDLLEDRPLVVFGKFRGPASGEVIVRGRTGGDDFVTRVPVEDHLEKPSHEPLRFLWARTRVRALSDWRTADETDRKEVLRLGLHYGIVTEQTSFVAVEDEVRNHTGALRSVDQPLPLPAGVSGLAVSSENSGGEVRYRKKTIIDFSDSLIEGELTHPDGAYMESRMKARIRPMIPVRKDFQDKMGGGMFGSQIGSVLGAGGLGLRGSGRGGGGIGASSAYGSATLGLKGQTKGRVKVNGMAPRVRGSLDKSIVRRVVREKRDQVRYCYERELTRTPGLGTGKVVMKFIVTATGSVRQASVSSSTLNSPAVESCLATRMRTWRFPKPQGGGIVVVTYPFLFSQGAASTPAPTLKK